MSKTTKDLQLGLNCISDRNIEGIPALDSPEREALVREFAQDVRNGEYEGAVMPAAAKKDQSKST